jgi:hypothetical protein
MINTETRSPERAPPPASVLDRLVAGLGKRRTQDALTDYEDDPDVREAVAALSADDKAAWTKALWERQAECNPMRAG